MIRARFYDCIDGAVKSSCRTSVASLRPRGTKSGLTRATPYSPVFMSAMYAPDEAPVIDRLPKSAMAIADGAEF